MKAFAACVVIAATLSFTMPAFAQSGTFSFAPNQLAANAWYKPGTPPSLINGHLDEAFGQADRWPKLLSALKKRHGSFSVFAAEIGYLSSSKGLLPLLKANHVPISVETPGFTQVPNGEKLAHMEILGEPVDGTNLYAQVFQITKPADRPNPAGKGWFVTGDGKPFIPDELLFDERIPGLLPYFDAGILAKTAGTWEQRKAAASITIPGTEAGTYAQRRQILMQDYVRYLNIARTHWRNKMPAVSLHWNVNPGWAWRDEAGLDAINSADPNWFNSIDRFNAIVSQKPQYGCVGYLNELIAVLTTAGYKPRTVYMDVDWTYNVPYITEVLKRHQAALKERGIQMGINVVEASIGDDETLRFEHGTLSRAHMAGSPPNVLYEQTLNAIFDYLKSVGLTGPSVQIRVGSWSHRPYERGYQISERTPGSLPHTALEIEKKL